MDIQMMILIVLSVVLVVAIAYLVVLKQPEQDGEHNSQEQHDHWL